MAHEVGVTLVIGSALAAGFYGVVSTAHTALKDLGSVTERVQKRQLLLGRAMDRFAQSGKPVDNLRRRYEDLGKTLEACRRKSQQLSESIMKGEALKGSRAAHLNAMRSQVASTIAVGAPVLKTVMDSARFSDALRDIAITGELDAQQERAAGHGLRHVAMRTNQSATDLAAGVGTLIANGMEVDKALAQAELLGKFTTATRASFDDAARMMVSFDTLGVSAGNMALAFSQAASAGKQGSFEVRDMARWFPQLGGLMKGLGVTGNEAVVSMASRLQEAMKTAGSTDEAANKMFSTPVGMNRQAGKCCAGWSNQLHGLVREMVRQNARSAREGTRRICASRASEARAVASAAAARSALDSAVTRTKMADQSCCH